MCITKDIHDKKHQETRDQIQTLEIELSEHTKADHDYQTTVATVLSVARRARFIFENSSETANKMAFLSLILQSPTVNGKKLDFTLASPFNLVLKLADNPNWLPMLDAFRTLNWVQIKKELSYLSSYMSLVKKTTTIQGRKCDLQPEIDRLLAP